MGSSVSRNAVAVLRALASAAWCAVIVAAMLSVPASKAYWATALLSCMIFFLAYYPRPLHFAAVGVSAVALAAARMFLVFHHFAWPDLSWTFALLGLAGWFVVGLRIVWLSVRAAREELVSKVVAPSVVLLILLFASNNLVNYMGLLNIRTFDLYAFSFDGSLGFQPSFVLGGWMQRYSWFGWPVLVAYLSILLPITLAFVVDAKKGLNRRWFLLELFFLASFLGYLFYNLFPAAGPLYVFPSFPAAPLTYAQTSRLLVEAIPVSPTLMRNALPSLHMAWALLIWWNMKKLSRTAYGLAFVYALFTICGTLGTGEHYAVDLVVSFPFAVMIQAIAERSLPFAAPLRWGSIAGGLAGVLGWVFLLRFENRLFWISPVVPWALIAVTVSLSLVAAFRLLAAAQLSAAPGAAPAAADRLPALAAQQPS